MPTEPTTPTAARSDKTVAAPQAWKPPVGGPQPDRPAAPAQKAPHPAVAPLNGPWPRVSVFGYHWTGPGRGATPATVGLLAAAAAVAAFVVADGGVGWLIAALAGTAALTGIRRLPERSASGTVPWPALTVRPPAADPVRYGWAAATILLLGVGTLRSAGWLFTLCVLTAVITGALAVAGGRSFRGLLVATLMALVSPFRAMPWVRQGLAAIRKPGAVNGMRVTATIATSVALLVLFGALFASADATFARVLESLVPETDGGALFRWVVVFVIAGGILGGAAFLRAAPPQLSGLEGDAPKKVGRFEWAIPLSLLTLLFAAFVAVQLTVLFGGSAHVMDTDGLTYAEYARGGFWQLLIVTGLTLLVLGGAARWAPRDTPADRLLIRLVLGALAVLTLVIVASALHRMVTYADTYGLTRLRLLVFLCEAWLGLVFVMVLLAGRKLRAGWLPRVAFGAGVLALLGLAVINPDGLIAERNVARFQQTGRIDAPYLAGLSADAVPALDRLAEVDPKQRDCVLSTLANGMSWDPDKWYAWSYGTAHAREVLDKNPPGSQIGCPPTRSY